MLGPGMAVLSLPLLLESSPRLLFAIVATVCLWLGLIYFNLLGSNNISRPEVRKARELMENCWMLLQENYRS